MQNMPYHHENSNKRETCNCVLCMENKIIITIIINIISRDSILEPINSLVILQQSFSNNIKIYVIWS